MISGWYLTQARFPEITICARTRILLSLNQRGAVLVVLGA